MASQLNVDLGGSTWTNKRASGYRSDLVISNGNVTATSYNNLRSAAFNNVVGGYTNLGGALVGSPANVVVNAGVTVLTQIGANSGAGNTINFVAQGALSLGNVGNLSTANNQIGYSSVMGWGAGGGVNTAVAANIVIGYYHAGTTNLFGLGTAQNQARRADTYYAFLNNDAVAQVQLGSLRSYYEFNAVNANTAGAITIDKAVSQVHQVNLTGNVTSVTYANMVSSLSDGTNTDEEVDTVTIIFNQGATGGYSVALPSGSDYKYAGGVNTVTTTANSVTLVAVTTTRISGVPTYLTTVSPGFV
jgi:hypothetical protein